MELLILLLENPERLVTREEISQRLWGGDTYVDTRHGVNTAVHKLRTALRDDSEEPRILETVVGRGYRLVAGVVSVSAAGSTSEGYGAKGQKSKVNGKQESLAQEKLDTADRGEQDAIDHSMATEPTPPAVDRDPTTPQHRRTWRWLVPGISLAALVGLAFWLNPGWLEQLSRFLFGRPPIRSIAVLPLDNLSGDPGQDYLAAGMTDELTTNLARIKTLRLVSRTTAMQYQHTHKSIPEIARELNVDAVVEGSVVRAGDTVRITTQLIDARRDAHLWAQSYERPISNILEVQDSVALDIASQVRVNLSAAERGSFSVRPSIRPNAYDDYLRGRNELTKQNPDAIQKSVEYFQRAIDDDPQYARAYAGLADAYSLLANYQVMLPAEAFPRAKAAALQALELAPDSPEALGSLALVKHHFDWDWAGAEQDYKRAIELQPNYATAHHRYAWFLSDVGRHEEAILEIRRAQELDPTSIVVQTNLGRVLYRARRFNEAIDVLRKAVTLDPNRLFSHIFLAMAYDQRGLCPEALNEYRIVQTYTGGMDGPGAVHAYARCNRAEDARRAMKILAGPSSDPVQDWFYVAGAFAALGDKEKAFEWLGKAVQNHDFFLTEMKEHPYMDPLRSDPRFDEFVKTIGFPN